MVFSNSPRLYDCIYESYYYWKPEKGRGIRDGEGDKELIRNPKDGEGNNNVEKSKGNPAKRRGDEPQYGFQKCVEKRQHHGNTCKRIGSAGDFDSIRIYLGGVKNTRIGRYSKKYTSKDVHFSTVA